MATELNKELLQQIIDNLKPANPRHEEFEKDLKDLLDKHSKPIRLSCEEQNLTDEDK